MRRRGNRPGLHKKWQEPANVVSILRCCSRLESSLPPLPLKFPMMKLQSRSKYPDTPRWSFHPSHSGSQHEPACRSQSIMPAVTEPGPSMPYCLRPRGDPSDFEEAFADEGNTLAPAQCTSTLQHSWSRTQYLLSTLGKHRLCGITMPLLCEHPVTSDSMHNQLRMNNYGK